MPTTPQEVSASDLDDAVARILKENGDMPDSDYRKWNTLLQDDVRKRQDRIEKKLIEWSPRLDLMEKNNILLWMKKSWKNFILFIVITSGYFTFVHDLNPWLWHRFEHLIRIAIGLI